MAIRNLTPAFVHLRALHQTQSSTMSTPSISVPITTTTTTTTEQTKEFEAIEKIIADLEQMVKRFHSLQTDKRTIQWSSTADELDAQEISQCYTHITTIIKQTHHRLEPFSHDPQPLIRNRRRASIQRLQVIFAQIRTEFGAYTQYAQQFKSLPSYSDNDCLDVPLMDLEDQLDVDVQQEVQQIQSIIIQLKQLRDIFDDLSNLLSVQSEALDRIDDHMTQSVTVIAETNEKQLIPAEKYAKSSGRMAHGCALFWALVVVVLFIVVIVKYTRN